MYENEMQYYNQNLIPAVLKTSMKCYIYDMKGLLEFAGLQVPAQSNCGRSYQMINVILTFINKC